MARLAISQIKINIQLQVKPISTWLPSQHCLWTMIKDNSEFTLNRISLWPVTSFCRKNSAWLWVPMFNKVNWSFGFCKSLKQHFFTWNTLSFSYVHTLSFLSYPYSFGRLEGRQMERQISSALNGLSSISGQTYQNLIYASWWRDLSATSTF